MLLAIDPGLRGCGVALFRDTGHGTLGELLQAHYVEGASNAQRAEAWLIMVEAVRVSVAAAGAHWGIVNQLVVELPQVYVTSRSKGDPNDLIALAAVVGGLCQAFSHAQQRVYLPAEWKGQAPKEVIHERADKRLTSQEKGRIVCRRKSLVHNVKDAVALGLKALGRM